MRWGSGWDTRDNRRAGREGADAQPSAHLGQSLAHACQADAACRAGKRLAGNADTIVRDDEMRGGLAEAKQQAHPGRARMPMDVGHAFLR